MTYSVIWIVTPNGFAADGRARLCLVAAPRVINRGNGTLGASPLQNWPALVRPLLDPMQLRLQNGPGGALAPVELDGELPDSELWLDLFPASTPVDIRGRGATALSGVTAAPSYTDAVDAIDTIYSGGGAADAGRAADLDRHLSAIAELGSRPPGRRAAAAAADPALAVAAPIVAFADGLRAPTDRPAASVGPGTNPLAGVRDVGDADFHQVVGLLMGHPTLARALGLRIDLLTPAFTGTRSIRIVTADGEPLNGDIPRAQSFSRVVSDPPSGRFLMATQPAGPLVRTEVINGMLDGTQTVEHNGTKPRYLVSTTDAAALSLQLVGFADARRQTRVRGAGDAVPASARLPVRRDIGFTISQRQRPAETVTFAGDRADAIENPDSAQRAGRSAAEVAALVPVEDGAAVLFADDVTNGYRVDVAVGDGGFRSLMRRRVAYRIGNRTLVAPDQEGRVAAITAVQQLDGDGVLRLRTGEQLATWSGWGLSVARPGRSVLGVTGPDGATTTDDPSRPAPGYDLTIESTAIAGSIPRLRFGREYQFQIRTVDLAGNSIAPDTTEPARALPKTRYRRKQAAPSPAVVPAKRFTAGESLHHWVVRTDGDGVPVGAGSQRHLVPAKVSQDLAERHGMFDAALGPDAGQPARDAAFTVAARESGTLLDPTVPGPDGAPVPAPGIAYVSNDPAKPPAPRPARGEGLPNGYYVVHDATAMRTPWLADPITDGAAIIGIAGQPGPVRLPFAGTGWPDVQPARVVVAPGTGALTKVSVKKVAGRAVTFLEVPPATMIAAELASTLRADRVADLDTDTDPADLAAGLDPAVSARQPITIVHATRRPVAAPAITGGPTLIPTGTTQNGVTAHGTSLRTEAAVQVHAASTARVDLIAGWRETLDEGTGPLVDEPRSTGIGSVDTAGAAVAQIKGIAHFGDLRHRTLSITPVATTAFREYFDVQPDRQDSLTRPGAPVTRSVPNRLLPPPPKVHSIVPTFSRTNSFDASVGLYTATTFVRGVRIQLARPWLTTGEDERLGVVVHSTAAEANSAVSAGRRVQDFVSQWGGDPLQEKDDLAWQPMVPEDFDETAPRHAVELIDGGAREKAQPNGQPSPFPPKVTVVSFPVLFDADRDLWFADVDLRLPANWPFVRLAVVRFQPQSVAGRTHSRVVLTDFVQLPPERQVQAQRVAGVGVKVEILGQTVAHSRFQLRQERRIGAPLVAGHDLGSSAGVGPTATPDPQPEQGPVPPATQPLFTDLDGWRLTDQRPGNGAIGRLRLDRAPGAPSLDSSPALQAVKAELRAGRVVVEEIQTGMDVRGPGRATRVVWTDTFDRSVVGMA